MKVALVLCLVLVCTLTQGYGTFAHFMSNLPAEVGHAFEVAWASVVDAIKKPVKSRRLRPGGRRRAHLSKYAHRGAPTTTEEPRFTVEFRQATLPYIEFTTTSSPIPGIRVKIPMIDKPLFRTIYEWKQLQTPMRLAGKVKLEHSAYEEVESEPEPEPEPPQNYNKQDDVDYNSIFGPLVIV